MLLVQATGDQAEFAFGSLEGPVDVDEREGRDGRDGGDERCDLDRCKLLQPFLERVVRRLPMVRRDVVRLLSCAADLAASDGLREPG